MMPASVSGAKKGELRETEGSKRFRTIHREHTVPPYLYRLR
jgi:hypothetical protein